MSKHNTLKPALNLVKFLDRFAKGELAALRKTHPEALAWFNWRTSLAADTVDETERGHVDNAIALDLLQKSIIPLRSELDALILNIRKRCNLCNQLKTWGGAISAAAGGVAFFVIFKYTDKDGAAAIASLVSAAGGLLSVCATSLERSPSGARVSAFKDLEALIGYRIDIEKIDQQIHRMNIFPLSKEAIEQSLSKTDDIALQILHFAS